MDDNTSVQKLLAEFLGTAMLIFVGAGSVPALQMIGGGTFTGSELGFVSLSFAAVVIVAVYVFGYVSGCHINPAVTVALAVGGKFAWKDVTGYLVAQFLGAFAGAAAIAGVLGQAGSDAGLGVTSYGADTPVIQALFAEFIGTFILVFAIFGAIYRKAAPGWAGLVIGFAVFAAIIPSAPITGSAINPARQFGPMLMQQFLGGSVEWGQIWVYFVGEILGAIVAALLFGVIAHTAKDAAKSAEVAS